MNKKESYKGSEIKIFVCKLCHFKGIRKEVRKHIRENHLWKRGYLSESMISRKF